MMVEYKELELKLLEIARLLNGKEARDRIKEEVEKYVSEVANRKLEAES